MFYLYKLVKVSLIKDHKLLYKAIMLYKNGLSEQFFN